MLQAATVISPVWTLKFGSPSWFTLLKNKQGMWDGQEELSIFWVPEQTGKTLKLLSVNFFPLWQKRGQVYGVQTALFLSFQNPAYLKDFSNQYFSECLTQLQI